MANPKITLSNDEHRNKAVVSHVFEKDYSALKTNTQKANPTKQITKPTTKPSVEIPIKYINLRKQDIHHDKHFIFVREAKGRKDRTTLFSAQVEKDLKEYYQEWKPNYWVVEGPGRKQYSATSVLNIVKNTARLANIKRTITPHMLRHSFATHLIEHGVSLRHIQLLMGHGSPKTTEVYTHIADMTLAKIKSPLDHFIDDNANNINKLQK